MSVSIEKNRAAVLEELKEKFEDALVDAEFDVAAVRAFLSGEKVAVHTCHGRVENIRPNIRPKMFISLGSDHHEVESDELEKGSRSKRNWFVIF